MALDARPAHLAGAALALLLWGAATARAAAPEEPSLPARVEAIEIRGLWLTRPALLERELPFGAGDEVGEELWRLAQARLWNTGILSRLTARLERRGETVIAVFEVEEKFTPSGIFAFQAGGGAGFLQLGLYDINVLGHFVEAGAFYERFGRLDGGQVWYREPRLFRKRLEALLLARSLVRPRPGFDLRRAAARLEVSGEHSDVLSVGGVAELFWDDIHDASEAAAPADSRGASAGAVVTLGRVDIDRLRRRGASLTLSPSAALTTDPVHPRFAQLSATALAFAAPGTRWTLALRATAGLSTAAPAQDLFYLGGLDTLRGFVDNAVRADRYAALNAEVRLTALDSTWFALMPVAFLDAAVAHAGPGPSALSSLGLGVRALVPRMNRVGFRVDVALPLRRGAEPGLSVGVYQFF